LEQNLSSLGEPLLNFMMILMKPGQELKDSFPFTATFEEKENPGQHLDFELKNKTNSHVVINLSVEREIV
jgi:hypothetical protein